MRRTRMNTEKFDGAPLFAGLSARQLAPIAAHADRLTIEAGRVLSRAGWTALELVVILDGIAIEAGGEHGWVSLGPGTALAPDAVATRGAFPATVTAATDLEILVVNGPAFRSAVGLHPVLARRVAEGRDRAPRLPARGAERPAGRTAPDRSVVVGSGA
jgi:CRP-like cAMP-binding protein